MGLSVLFLSCVSAVRLPTVGGDNETWGNVLNGYLVALAGENASELNGTMVNGSNIYASSVNSSHLVSESVGSDEIVNGSIVDADISDSTNLTLGQKITFALGEVIDNVVDGFVRVTGNLDLDNNNLTNVTKVGFSVAGCTDGDVEGEVCWNADDMMLSVSTGMGKAVNVGQETTLIAKNIDSVTLQRGQVITLVGSSGTRGEIVRADAGNASLASRLAVVSSSSCAVNNPCLVTVFGRVINTDTSGWTEGSLLYLAADGSGNLTSIAPDYPDYRVLIAAVIRSHASEGILLVSPQIDYANHLTFNAIDVVDYLYTSGYVNASRFASEGKFGVNVSGASCTITEITNGIITNASCV